MAKPIQPRLSQRELESRDIIIAFCWNKFKNRLTMEEMANIFRMPLGQYFKIVKSKFNQKKNAKI